MRRSTHTLFVVWLILAIGGLVRAEESPSFWWPFGKPEEEPEATAVPASSPPPVIPEANENSSWWPEMPKFQWPQFSAPSSPHEAPRTTRARSASRSRPGPIRQRNAWAHRSTERTESQAEGSSWDSVTSGAQRWSESTRSAWHKTVDALTPGSSDAVAPATPPEPRVSWWDRLWAAEDPQSEGPRTVTEWMAQDRLDP